MKVESIISEYVSNLEFQSYSQRTIESYQREIMYFMEFLKEHYPRIQSMNVISKHIIVDYQSFISERTTKNGIALANTTIKMKIAALKSFFSYLASNDIILRDPTTSIALPRGEQRLTRNILTEKEVLELLRRVKPRTPTSIRNRAILELFYACGIRTFELCNLMVGDIDFKAQTITILHGKGDKPRVLPIGQYACHYIQLYLQKSRKYMLKGKVVDPGNLFLTNRGNPFNRSSINSCVIRSIMRDMKLDKHISCYSFRHSIATHLLARNVDIAYIAQLLGHSSLETTQRYLKIEISDLKKVHSQFHPRENDKAIRLE